MNGGAYAPVLGKTQLHDSIVAVKGERKCSRSSKEEMLSPVAMKEGLLPFLPAVGAGLLQADGGCSCWNRGKGGLPHTRVPTGWRGARHQLDTWCVHTPVSAGSVIAPGSDGAERLCSFLWH